MLQNSSLVNIGKCKDVDEFLEEGNGLCLKVGSQVGIELEQLRVDRSTDIDQVKSIIFIVIPMGNVC